MTNPGNAVGTDGAYGGRTSVNAFNDVLAAFDGRGILQGWACKPKEGMTISFGGQALVRDVAIAENDLGQKTTINNRSNQPVDLTLEEAPALGSRIDVIVAYVNNPPDVAPPTAGASIEIDNPSVCGMIAVVGNVSNTPVAPDETAIRTAITADGAAGSTAYYVILATITIATGTTVITPSAIVAGRSANLGSAAIADGSVTTQKLGNGAVTTDKIGKAAVTSSNIDYASVLMRGSLQVSDQWEKLPGSGCYHVSPEAYGTPPVSPQNVWFVLIHFVLDESWANQIAIELGGSRTYLRAKTNGSWGAWHQVTIV